MSAGLHVTGSRHATGPVTAPDGVAYACPQCAELIHITRPRVTPYPSGALLLDPEPLVRALALHMRVGCHQA